MEEINLKSAERLKEERVLSGYTQEGLAKNITTQQQITYLEKGKRKLSYDMAYPLAKKLGVRVEYLMGDDDFRTDEDLAKNYWGDSLDYQTNLDFKFEALLNALEIKVIDIDNQHLFRKTVIVDQQLKEIDKGSYNQIVKYTIKTPNGKKVISEEEFIRFKNQICKYIIFLAKSL